MSDSDPSPAKNAGSGFQKKRSCPLWLKPVVKLLIRNLHLVNEDTVRRGGAVAIELKGIGELVIHGPGEKRVVRDVHRHPHAVNGKRVMEHGVCDRVIVVFGHNVVPGSRGEACKSKTSGVPAFQAVIKNAPLVAGIQSLPAEVVDPSVQNLLALKLNCLGRVSEPARDIEIKSYVRAPICVVTGVCC